jgi:GMP synthase (glutamine-hydrolysing)
VGSHTGFLRSPAVRVLVVQHEPEAPPGQLGEALTAAGIEADVRRPREGDALPETSAGLAGLAVLGGAMGARDDDAFPHLAATRALIREAAEADVPVLGICLGSQLAADALGGASRRGERGWEIGWCPARPVADDPVARALGGETPLFQWHQDTFERPPGAEPLFHGGRYDEQGFRLGPVWAVQAHPEVDGAIVQGWIDMGNADAELTAAGVSAADLLEPVERCAPAGRRLLDAWAAEVRRRARGR